jgi:hypothetical protein
LLNVFTQVGFHAFNTLFDACAKDADCDAAYPNLKQVFYETPFYVTATLRFTGVEVSCAMETNVGFGGTKKPAVTGRSE